MRKVPNRKPVTPATAEAQEQRPHKALAMAARFGTSSQKAAVKAKLKSKPSKKDRTPDTDEDDTEKK